MRPPDSHFYILDGRTPVAKPMTEWAMWFERNQESRQIARTEVGIATVSTVFLGIDHQWADGPPILFETMIFGGEHEGWQERYVTWEDAERTHESVCAALREGREP